MHLIDCNQYEPHFTTCNRSQLDVHLAILPRRAHTHQGGARGGGDHPVGIDNTFNRSRGSTAPSTTLLRLAAISDRFVFCSFSGRVLFAIVADIFGGHLLFFIVGLFFACVCLDERKKYEPPLEMSNLASFFLGVDDRGVLCCLSYRLIERLLEFLLSSKKFYCAGTPCGACDNEIFERVNRILTVRLVLGFRVSIPKSITVDVTNVT